MPLTLYPLPTAPLVGDNARGGAVINDANLSNRIMLFCPNRRSAFSPTRTAPQRGASDARKNPSAIRPPIPPFSVLTDYTGCGKKYPLSIP